MPGGRIDKYLLSSQIAVGGQATVWLANDLTSMETVAIKVFNLNGPDGEHMRKTYRNEMAALNMIGTHERIVKVIEHMEDVKFLKNKGNVTNVAIVVMELLQKDVYELMGRSNGSLSDSVLRFYIKQLL